MQTDIFIIDRKGKHIFDIISDNKLIEKLKSQKPIEKHEYIIYTHGNLNLTINQKTKYKVCERIEHIETKLDNSNNILYVESEVTKMPIESFPIINKYDNIINRDIILYANGFRLVKDHPDTLHIRVENDANIAVQIINNFLEMK